MRRSSRFSKVKCPHCNPPPLSVACPRMVSQNQKKVTSCLTPPVVPLHESTRQLERIEHTVLSSMNPSREFKPDRNCWTLWGTTPNSQVHSMRHRRALRCLLNRNTGQPGTSRYVPLLLEALTHSGSYLQIEKWMWMGPASSCQLLRLSQQAT